MRVYWRIAGAARTATLTLPAGDPARPRPLAWTTGRCKPRRNARLVVRAETVVVSRAGGAIHACRPTRGRTHRLGAVSEPAVLSDREVACAKPGRAGNSPPLRVRIPTPA